MSIQSPQLAQYSKLHVHVPYSVLALIVIAVATTVLTWEQRHRTRRALKNLTNIALQDIGITRKQAREEARRMFWQA
ncbi:MAG: DUF1127 domain-containing protein [Paracoccaceae bacterium]